MRRWLLVLILVSLLGLNGCSKSINFNGKSQFWRVGCTVQLSAKTKSYVIQYIGNKDQPITDVSFRFNDSKNFENSGKSDSHSRNLKMSGKSTLDTPYLDETNFTLYIKWNDQEETIQLTKEDS
ncbi:hypothetical protein [Paenibacillus sp. SI8]|uniref:hypothetical protein n=1 Tax=unclassified Paenibacillus TaxID=185978 RepID=UPI003467C6D3